jgi:hypothetical protein
MSMRGCYRRIAPAELRRLVSNSNGIEDFLSPDEEIYAALPAELFLEVDKAWLPIHYLLCGTMDEQSGPLGNVVLGGSPIGPDLSYGPARYLTPSQVQEAAQALAAIPVNDLMDRFDKKKMIEAGALSAYSDADENEDRAYIAFHYAALQRFFQDAANTGDAILLWIS